MNNLICPKYPFLLDKIERLMRFISKESDVLKLNKRRVLGVFYRTLGKQAFIDLFALVDYRDTILKEKILSPIYLENMTVTVDSIERTMPPQYHQDIVFCQAVMQ